MEIDSNGDVEEPSPTARMSNTGGGGDASDVWALAAGELTPERRREVCASIASDPAAVEELLIASFVMSDSEDDSAAPSTLSRLRDLEPEWFVVEPAPSEVTNGTAPVTAFRVRLRPCASCHALLFAAARGVDEPYLKRLYPHVPPFPLPIGDHDRPSNPLPADVETVLPAFGTFQMTSDAGLVLLWVRVGRAFDEPSISAIERDVFERLRAGRASDGHDVEDILNTLRHDDAHCEWRSVAAS